MEQELKIKKWKVWSGCLVWLFLVFITIYSLFTKFSINLSSVQTPLIYPLKKAFYFIGALVLVFYFAKTLYEWCILARKGYAARMNEKGLLLANDRLIGWHEIEDIEAIPEAFRRAERIVITLKLAPPRNRIVALFKKMDNEKIVLTQFKLSLEKAYRLLNEYWYKYR